LPGKIVYLAGQPAIQLVYSNPARTLRTGPDHFDHSLRLSQVETTIQKCALGKLAGAGHLCAGFKKKVENAAQNLAAAMAMDLDDIFTSVRAGTAHNNRQDFINQLIATVIKTAQIQPVRLHLCGGGGFAAEDLCKAGGGP